jgi:hypothetical protein
MSKVVNIKESRGAKPEDVASNQTETPKRPRFHLRSFLLLMLAKMGMRSMYIVTAEVMNMKGSFGKVQFIFECRPWLLALHAASIAQMAASKAVDMKMLKSGEPCNVTILMISKVGAS